MFCVNRFRWSLLYASLILISYSGGPTGIDMLSSEGMCYTNKRQITKGHGNAAWHRKPVEKDGSICIPI